MFTPLTGRTVLVTGGTKGIGKGIAGVFARAGANVAIAGRDRERGRGGRRRSSAARYLIADVAQAADCERMVGRDGRALRRPRRPVRERRHLPRRQARRHERAGHRRDLRHQRQGHDAVGQGRAEPARGAAATAASSSPPRSPGRSPASRAGRTTARPRPRSSASCAPPRSSWPRASITINAVMPGNIVTEGLDELGAGVPRDDGGRRSRRAGSARSRTSATRRCSSPPTRPATSPGRRSSSTAARCCPRSHDGARGACSRAMEGSAVSLGPTALAARERLLARAAPGRATRLGAERELAERLGVSRSTIRAALGDLERGGVIRRTRGRGGGIFVAERKVERDLTSARRPARLPAPRRLPVRRAGALDRDRGGGRRRGAGAGARRRARWCSRSCACGWPTASRSRSSARCSRPSASPACSTARSAARCTSCCETHYGLAPGEAEERIEVVAAGAAEARLLELRRGAPLLAVARTAWDADGRPFERSHDLFRADRARMVVRSLPRQESGG